MTYDKLSTGLGGHDDSPIGMPEIILDDPTNVCFSYAQVAFCARECERQRDVGPLGVALMMQALQRAMYQDRISVQFIHDLGRIVDPRNFCGWRTVGVHFGDGDTSQTSPPEAIRGHLDLLVSQVDDLTPSEFYEAFEGIHPYKDGNGRVGAILWNMLNGTLDNPVSPPDAFGSEHADATAERVTYPQPCTEAV